MDHFWANISAGFLKIWFCPVVQYAGRIELYKVDYLWLFVRYVLFSTSVLLVKVKWMAWTVISHLLFLICFIADQVFFSQGSTV